MELDLTNIILGVLTFIGAILSTFFGFKANASKNKNDERIVVNTAVKDLIERLEKEIDRISAENSSLRSELQRDRERISELEKKDIQKSTRMMLLESAHNHKPFPDWLKDVDGIMLSLNPPYEDEFLRVQNLKSYDYIGHKDDSVFSSETSKNFTRNDKIVELGNSKYRFVIEDIVGINGFEFGPRLILKYKREFSDHLVGIGGQSFTMDDAKSISDQYLEFIRSANSKDN